jgi:phenylalanyl-tRNA synthetase beta subunit
MHSFHSQLFEISDVVLKDDSKDVGARNERRLCFGYYGQTSGLEVSMTWTWTTIKSVVLLLFLILYYIYFSFSRMPQQH